MNLSVLDIIFDDKILRNFLKDFTSSISISFREQIAYISHFIQSENDVPYKSLAKELLSSYTQTNNLTASMLWSDISEFITNPTFKTIGPPKFKFIDLFAGIGGFRIALQNLGGKCVFSSEWDKDAQHTYFANFGELPFGDITQQSIKDCIPDKYEILCAGFPCQAFSIAGYQKGFEDTRGTLFFDVATIIEKHRPKAFFLENVKNLKSHDNGKTFFIIEKTLRNLGYEVYSKVLNSMEYANIPQNRERIFIVGFDPKQVENYDKFRFPQKEELTKTIHECIDYSIEDENLFYRENSRYYPFLKQAMVDNDTVYQWRRQYVRENQSNVCPTLTANMGTGGHNVPLIITPDGFRKLTPRECLNFQGYPVEYKFPKIANSKKYKQAGNSVTVPLIQKVANNIIDIIT